MKQIFVVDCPDGIGLAQVRLLLASACPKIIVREVAVDDVTRAYELSSSELGWATTTSAADREAVARVLPATTYDKDSGNAEQR